MATAKIVVVYNSKGGVGKTTTTCQLAGTLGHRGFDVLVADLDAQQTAASWIGRQNGQNFPATVWSGFRYGANTQAELQKLAGKYDIIVVDCAPSVDQPGTWASLLVADLAIIPTKLNPADTDALPAAKLLTEQARRQCGFNFPSVVLATAYRRNRIDEKMALEILRQDNKFPVLDVTLGDRTAFSRSMLYGATAHSMPKAKEAVDEIDALTDIVIDIIGLNKQK